MKNFNDCTRKEQVARWENVLRVLQALTPHQRRKHWDMTIFGKKTECGTIACAAGHCSLDPWFRRRGFRGSFAQNSRELVSQTNILDDDPWLGYDVPNFFGPTEEGGSGEEIFMNDNPRRVDQVIREVKARIKELKVTS